MPYAASDDLTARFGDELAESQPSAGAIAQALAAADAEIDGYLRGRYRLPLGESHELLTQIACDLARYNIYKDGASEAIRRRADEARGKLKDLSRGVIRLDEAAGGRRVAGMPVMSSPPKVFGRRREA